MTLEELEEALEEVFPRGFQIETDNDGQLVIYTGLMESDDGDLLPFGDEEDEGELDFEEHEVYDESDED